MLRYLVFCGTELQCVAAYLGGLLSFEIVKRRGKFTPINGLVHHSFFEALPATSEGLLLTNCDRQALRTDLGLPEMRKAEKQDVRRDSVCTMTLRIAMTLHDVWWHYFVSLSLSHLFALLFWY